MFQSLSIEGVYEGLPKENQDSRGSVTKIFSRSVFEKAGIDCNYNETLVVKNPKKGVMRGFHFQYPPYAQSKLIYCSSGECIVYLLDLRKGSAKYGECQQVQLSEEKGSFIIVPEGVANAYFTTQEQTTIVYQLAGGEYMPEYEGGIRWDSVGLQLACDEPIVSIRDSGFPTLADFESPFIWEEN